MAKREREVPAGTAKLPPPANGALSPEELYALYRAATEALADPNGPSMTDINKAINKRTGGQYPGYASMSLDFDPEADVGPGFEDQVRQYHRAKANRFSDPMSGLEAAAYGAQDIGAFGFADELEGGLQGIVAAGGEMLRTPLEKIGLVEDNQRGIRQTFHDVYEQQRDAMRAGQQQAREQRPGATAAGGVVGAVLPALATGGVTLPGHVARGTQAGRAAQPLLRRAGSGAMRGAAGGAAGGAAYGFGSGEDMQQRAMGAFQQGALGGALGGGIGAVMPLMGAALSRAADKASIVDPRAGGTASPAATRKALKLLDTGLEMADTSADDVIARAKKMGPNASLADVDEVLAAQAGAAREMGPGVRKTGGVAEGIRDRSRKTGERMANFLRKETGDITIDESLREATAARARVRSQYFDPLEYGSTDVLPAGSEFASRTPHAPGARLPAGAVQGQTPAAQIIGSDLDDLVKNNAEIRKLVEEVKPDWRPGMKLTFREAQEVSQLSREMKYHPDILQRPARSRRWTTAADEIDGIMEKQIPGFREANRQYAAAVQRIDAHELGGKMANKRPREIKEAYDNLTKTVGGKKVPNKEAQEAFRLGMLDYVEGTLLKRTGTGGGPGSLIDAGPEVRERLRILFPSEESFQRWINSLEIEDRFRTTQTLVNGGSQTAVKQEMKNVLANGPNLTGSKLTIINRALARLNPTVRREAAEVIGDILLTQGEEGVEQFVRLLEMRQSAVARIGRGMGQVNVPGMAGAGAYVGSGGGLLTGRGDR